MLICVAFDLGVCRPFSMSENRLIYWFYQNCLLVQNAQGWADAFDDKSFVHLSIEPFFWMGSLGCVICDGLL